MLQTKIDQDALLRAWGWLALAALAVAWLTALPAAGARWPEPVGGALFAEKAVVLHAFAAGWWLLLVLAAGAFLPPSPALADRAAFVGLALFGFACLLAAVLAKSPAVMTRFLPVFFSADFLAAFAGTVCIAFAALFRAATAAGTRWLLVPLVAVIGAEAMVAFRLSGESAESYLQVLSWVGGFSVQFLWSVALVLSWFQLMPACGLPEVAARFRHGILALTALPALGTWLVQLSFHPAELPFAEFLSLLGTWGLWPGVFGAVAYLLWAMQRIGWGALNPFARVLLASIAVFTFGTGFSLWRGPDLAGGLGVHSVQVALVISALLILQTRGAFSWWSPRFRSVTAVLATVASIVVVVAMAVAMSSAPLPADGLQVLPKGARGEHAQRKREEEIRVRLEQGVVMLRRKEWDNAAVALHRVLALDPERYEAQANMGYVMVGKGDFRVALDFFNAAINLEPEIALAYYGRGLALEGLERFDDAADEYVRFLHLAPVVDRFVTQAQAKVTELRNKSNQKIKSSGKSESLVPSSRTGEK